MTRCNSRSDHDNAHDNSDNNNATETKIANKNSNATETKTETKIANNPTWDLAAAELFSSSYSGSDSSWDKSHNTDINKEDFLPHHNSAVFCRNRRPTTATTHNTPPTTHNSTHSPHTPTQNSQPQHTHTQHTTSGQNPYHLICYPHHLHSNNHNNNHNTHTHTAHDLWTEPVPPHMLPTPSPPHPHTPSPKPHYTRTHYIHLKYLKRKHTLTKCIYPKPPPPHMNDDTFHMNDTLHMNDTIHMNDTLNETTTYAPAPPHMINLPISPITMYSPKAINVDNNTEHHITSNNTEHHKK